MEKFLDGRVVLHCGDCRDVLKTIADSSIDSIVTDPPYALVSIVKRFGKPDSAPAKGNEAYMRASAGFMGKQWDNGETAFAVEFWAECLRVLKPGGHVVAFGGTRTYHRMACAIEDAGFEIRDMLQWLYGQGFPKSHNAGNGWGTALKPACEPILLGRKPLSDGTVAANVLRHGTGAINVDGCRIANPTGESAGGGWGGRQASSIGYGGTTPDGYATQNKFGRWPANVLHDGSEEVVAAFPETRARGNVTPTKRDKSNGVMASNGAAWGIGQSGSIDPGDSGSAARFFYASKADSDDRLGSKHPTVKPVDLMQWLCRLVTPPGGTILDPFAGTGITGEAAFREGFNAVLIEAETEYQVDIRRRMALVLAGPDERSRESIKAKNLPRDDGPLFTVQEVQEVQEPAKPESWDEMWARPFDWDKFHGTKS